MKSLGLKTLFSVLLQGIILSASPIYSSALRELERVRKEHSSLESFLLNKKSLLAYYVELSNYWNLKDDQFDELHDFSIQVLLYLIDLPSHLEIPEELHQKILNQIWQSPKQDFFPTSKISLPKTKGWQLIKSPSSFHSIWASVYFGLPPSTWLYFSLSGVDENTTDYFLEHHDKFLGIVRAHKLFSENKIKNAIFFEFFGDFNKSLQDKKISSYVLEEIQSVFTSSRVFISSSKGLEEIHLPTNSFDSKFLQNLYMIRDFNDGRDWIRETLKALAMEPFDFISVNGEKRALFSSLDFNNTGPFSWVFEIPTKDSKRFYKKQKSLCGSKIYELKKFEKL